MSNRKPVRSRKRIVPLRTAEQARQWLRDNGMSVAAFARAHEFKRDTVADLVNGRSQGNYGEAHRAAVALGMKPNPQFPAMSRNYPQGR